MQVHDQLAQMTARQLREFASGLIETIASKDHELTLPRFDVHQATQP